MVTHTTCFGPLVQFSFSLESCVNCQKSSTSIVAINKLARLNAYIIGPANDSDKIIDPTESNRININAKDCKIERRRSRWL